MCSIAASVVSQSLTNVSNSSGAPSSAVGDQSFHTCVGNMAVGMENTRCNFDELARMSDENDLFEPKADGLFNHVADKVAHGDHHLRVNPHLFSDKTFAMVTRHQHHVFKSRRTFDFQLQRQ